jgi:hypothetical protein
MTKAEIAKLTIGSLVRVRYNNHYCLYIGRELGMPEDCRYKFKSMNTKAIFTDNEHGLIYYFDFVC